MRENLTITEPLTSQPAHPKSAKTLEVARDLAQRLHAREWAPNDMLPPRGVLSAHYNVSPATVSNAISELKSRRLLRSIPGKGVFVAMPPESRRGLSKAQAMRVVALAGVYLPEGEQLKTLDRARMDRLPIISELHAASREQGTALVMLPNCDHHVDVSLLQTLNVDGLILLGGYSGDELLKLHRSSIPVVLGNDPRLPLPLSFVDYDNEGAMREIIDRFAASGHQRIGYIGLETSVQGYIEHLRTCFVQNLLDKGLCYNFHRYWTIAPYARSFRNTPEQLSEIGEELVGRLFDQDEPPTAIYCAQQQLLTGVLSALEKRRLSVPGHVSLMARYDFPEDAPASGLVHPREQLSRELLRTLAEVIEDSSHISQVRLPLPFVDRGTVRQLI